MDATSMLLERHERGIQVVCPPLRTPFPPDHCRISRLAFILPPHGPFQTMFQPFPSGGRVVVLDGDEDVAEGEEPAVLARLG